MYDYPGSKRRQKRIAPPRERERLMERLMERERERMVERENGYGG